jgi:hypothetical protein
MEGARHPAGKPNGSMVRRPGNTTITASAQVVAPDVVCASRTGSIICRCAPTIPPSRSSTAERRGRKGLPPDTSADSRSRVFFLPPHPNG